MMKTLKSQKGIFLALIAYPIFFILMALSLVVFIRTSNANNNVKIQFSSLQAYYQAIKGVDYAYAEVKNHLYTTPLVTHDVDPDNLLSLTGTPYNDLISGTNITSDGYTNISGNSDGFTAKVYLVNRDRYILSKGKYKSREKLFIYRMTGTSIYDYFMFSAGNLFMGSETYNLLGGKIHSNSDIILGEGSRILNAAEVSAVGKMYMNYARHIDNPNADDGWLGEYRYPYYLPVGKSYAVGNQPANNVDGVYRNNPDGHYPGDHYGLYMAVSCGSAPSPACPGSAPIGTKIMLPWDPSSGQPAIPASSLEDNTGAYGVNWSNSEYSDIYQQEDVNCRLSVFDPPNYPTPCANTANGHTNNQYYNSSMPRINDIAIPNRLPGASNYSINQFMPRYTSPPAITVSVNLSDSQKTAAAWDAFINYYEGEITPGQTSINGILKDVVKAGTRNGAASIAVPSVNVEALVASAKDAGQGMVIEKIVEGGNWGTPTQVKITINAGKPTGGKTFYITENKGTSASIGTGGTLPGCAGTIFTQRKFMNANTAGWAEDVLEINVGKLIECAATEPGQNGNPDWTDWIPLNGVIYSDYNLALKNAAALPTQSKGLTTVVRGNLYIQGNYNTTNFQPSAAIVRDVPYLLSNTFNWPTYLPVTQHYPDYPFKPDPNLRPSGFTGYKGAGGVPDPDSLNLVGTGDSADFWTNDTTNSFNWLYHHDCDNAGIPGGQTPAIGKCMPKRATANTQYNISLIGLNATGPQVLERWSYFANPGNDTGAGSAPSGKTTFTATVQGAFAQIDDEIPGQNPSTQTWESNPRECGVGQNPNVGYSLNGEPTDIRISGLSPIVGSSAYPCRQNVTAIAQTDAPDDLITWAPTITRQYEPTYATSAARPPGNLLGLIDSALVELENTTNNWNYHRADLFPAVN